MAIIVTTGPPILNSQQVAVTLLSVIQEACTYIGLDIPTAVFSSTVREHVELRALANEMAQRIAFDTFDWPKLKSRGSITGDGTTTDFALPSDYRRMVRNGGLYRANAFPAQTLTYVSNADDWLSITLNTGFFDPYGSWTIANGAISVLPAPASGEVDSYNYISNLYALSAASQPKSAFTADDDSFVLDNRLLRLGIVWQWKAQKGFDYAEDMANFEEALARLTEADRGSIIVSNGSRRMPPNVRVGWPWPLG